MGWQEIARSRSTSRRSVVFITDDATPRFVRSPGGPPTCTAGLNDVPVMTIDSITAQKRLIEAGIGIALLPESSIHEELRLETLRTIDVSHLQTTVPIHVLYRKNGYLTGASRTLLTLISNVPVRPSSPAHRNRKRK